MRPGRGSERGSAGAPGARRCGGLAAAALAGLLAIPAPSAAQEGRTPQPSATAAATITGSDLRREIGVLAADSMRGRDTPSPELSQAARYVADAFRSEGLLPGLGETFLQYYPVTVIEAGSAASQRLVITGPDGDHVLRGGRDFVAAPTGSHLVGRGPLRRVQPDSGALVPDSALMVVEARPATMQRVFASVRSALRKGEASGALVVVDAPTQYFANLRRFFGTRRVSIGRPDLPGEPVALVSAGALPPELGKPLTAGKLLPYGWSATLETDGRVRADSAMNVIGWLPGSDPDLRSQYVMFTAHLDHLGVGRPADGDSIFNGADDDASGVATLLELAQAYASAAERPRRSLVFMAVSGEEKGLLGSTWYTDHPVFPLGRTVAEVNMDMIGRNAGDTVAALGKGMSSLGTAVERAATSHPELGLSVAGDRWPQEHVFERSDHYNFARKGVPVLFFFGGLHEDYHRPSDEADRIEYDKTARIGRLIYYLGLDVADADRPPRWDPDAYDRVVEGGRSR